LVKLLELLIKKILSATLFFLKIQTRHLFATYGGYYTCGLRKDDVIYVSLPMYHSTGGLLGAGMALLCGCTVVLRKQFSVSNFWTDCIKYQCTVLWVNLFPLGSFSIAPSFLLFNRLPNILEKLVDI